MLIYFWKINNVAKSKNTYQNLLKAVNVVIMNVLELEKEERGKAMSIPGITLGPYVLLGVIPESKTFKFGQTAVWSRGFT